MTRSAKSRPHGGAEPIRTRILDVGDPDRTAGGRRCRVIGTTDGVFLAVGWLADQMHSDMVGFLVEFRWRREGDQRVLVSAPRAPEPYASTAAWLAIRDHQARARRAVARRRRR